MANFSLPKSNRNSLTVLRRIINALWAAVFPNTVATTADSDDWFAFKDISEGNHKRISVTNLSTLVGGGASTWADLDKTVSDIADITDKSHTSLTDIGTNTHVEIDSHIADDTIHFTDAPTDGLPYSRKDNDWEVITLLPPVEEAWDITEGLPEDPEDGDRYVSDGTDEELGWYDGYIYEWDEDEGEWFETIPLEGFMIWLIFEMIFWVFFSGGWMEVGSGTYVPHSLATAENDFIVASGEGSFVKKTLAETKVILGAGDVTKVGTPVDNQLGIWTGDGTIEGDPNLFWTGTILGIKAGGYIETPKIINTPSTTLQINGIYFVNNYKVARAAAPTTYVEWASGILNFSGGGTGVMSWNGTTFTMPGLATFSGLGDDDTEDHVVAIDDSTGLLSKRSVASLITQQAHIVDADGSLADITTKFNTLLSQLETMGLLATS